MSSVSDAKDQTYELTAAHLEALSKIKTLIGPSGYITETDVMQPHVVDWRGIYKGRTELVVYPKTTQEVADIVKICAQGVMPIVPQGGNTSMCGGSVPLENSPSIVLCLSRMNRIRDFDKNNYTMTVEAGCILQKLQQIASESDRYLSLIHI